ncbi:MAG: diacylglycerol kinase family lipid kinase [Clostridia bacterium]|nr:diacylglycerol kinase family lipid kinase [Clostridia bacterium]
MKYHFIINPAAGKGKLAKGLAEKIKSSAKAAVSDIEVYFTTKVGDATEYVKRIADGGEHAFFACGGDGTLCEVANGIMALGKRDGVYMGTVPSGTGNDFVRNFSSSEKFFDIDAQLSAKPMDIDLIGCNDMYAVNMINIGFDCEVVCEKERLQKHKLIPSKLAYIAGLVLTLIRKPGVECRISYDGGEMTNHKLLLTTYANGEFCGGGFHSNPESAINNGKINTIAVKDITRRKFLSIVGSYKNGTHLKFTDILNSRMSDTVDMEFDGETNISVDGEIFKVRGLSMRIAKDAVKFLVPEGAEYKKASRVAEAMTV